MTLSDVNQQMFTLNEAKSLLRNAQERQERSRQAETHAAEVLAQAKHGVHEADLHMGELVYSLLKGGFPLTLCQGHLDVDTGLSVYSRQ